MIDGRLPIWARGFVARVWQCIGYPCCCSTGGGGACACSHCTTGTTREFYDVTFTGVTNGTCSSCNDFNTTTYRVAQLSSPSCCSYWLDIDECGGNFDHIFMTIQTWTGGTYRVQLGTATTPTAGESTFETGGLATPENCSTKTWTSPQLYYVTGGGNCTWSSSVATITPV